ncbi:MAG: NUDIX domain-containing protein [Patescibacteria group bacterium]
MVDEANKPLKPLPRSLVHKNLLFHRTAGIWVINESKQILCQKRSLKKDIKPGMWEAFFGGHLGPGEDYLGTAVKEVSEELGISVTEEDLVLYKILKSGGTHNEFQFVCALKLRRNDLDFNFEKEEIDELQWYPLAKLKEILLDRQNINWVHKPWDAEVLNWLATLT